VDALGGLPLGGRRFQVQPDVDPFYNEDPFFFLNLADCVGHQPIVSRVDLAHFQCAGKGAGESTGRGGDDVVESRRARLVRVRRDLVVGRDGAVDAEDDRLLLGRQVGLPHRSFDAFDPDF